MGLLADTELGAALQSLYFLLEAEEVGKFYLIFDYRPTLPTAANELAALPSEALDRAYAVLEFDDPQARDREVEAIRRSLRDTGDNGAGVAACLQPTPPALSASDAGRVLSDPASEERQGVSDPRS